MNRHKSEPALGGWVGGIQRGFIESIKAERSSARGADQQRNVKGKDGEEKTPQERKEYVGNMMAGGGSIPSGS